jgi:formylglycine-generating enzyme required for sulfatase activity
MAPQNILFFDNDMKKIKIFLISVASLSVVLSLWQLRSKADAGTPVTEWNPHGQYCVTEAPSSTVTRLASGLPANRDNSASPSDSDFKGMAKIPTGEFWMGDSAGEFLDAKPLVKVQIKSFWIDKYAVTNKQFAEFVEATGYVTLAERPLSAKDYPELHPDDLLPASIVFSPPDHAVDLSQNNTWWKIVRGANWRSPLGPKNHLHSKENDPVVHIAYEDAEAYARWKGKRLPTEAEWEYAARGGLDRKIYPWGNDLHPQGKFMANTWQGEFPTHDKGEDGFMGIAPVGSFPPNAYGLYDMSGNVWQWVSDWYRPDTFEKISMKDKAVQNPQGPRDSYDPQEPGIKKRVQKGGSFLCTDQYCSRFRVGTRGKGDIFSSTNHLGFRLVQDAY